VTRSIAPCGTPPARSGVALPPWDRGTLLVGSGTTLLLVAAVAVMQTPAATRLNREIGTQRITLPFADDTTMRASRGAGGEAK
jgi:hypothetical protein